MVEFGKNPESITVTPAPERKKEPETIDATKIPGVEIVQAIDQELSETPVIDGEQSTAPDGVPSEDGPWDDTETNFVEKVDKQGPPTFKKPKPKPLVIIDEEPDKIPQSVIEKATERIKPKPKKKKGKHNKKKRRHGR